MVKFAVREGSLVGYCQAEGSTLAILTERRNGLVVEVPCVKITDIENPSDRKYNDIARAFLVYLRSMLIFECKDLRSRKNSQRHWPARKFSQN